MNELPERNGAAVAVHADDLPCLVSHLHAPQAALLPVQLVAVPFALDELAGLRIPAALPLFPFPASGLTCDARWRGSSGRPWWRYRVEAALAPGAQAQVEDHLPALTVPRCACPEFCEVGTWHASEQRRCQDRADAVLQPQTARLGTGSPRAELRHHAVPRARNQTGLLQPWPRLKILADGIVGWRTVGSQHAAHLPCLDSRLAV